MKEISVGVKAIPVTRGLINRSVAFADKITCAGKSRLPGAMQMRHADDMMTAFDESKARVIVSLHEKFIGAFDDQCEPECPLHLPDGTQMESPDDVRVHNDKTKSYKGFRATA
jgi:hypothetical protein